MKFKKLKTYQQDDFLDFDNLEEKARDSAISTATTNTPLVFGLAPVLPATDAFVVVSDECAYFKIAIDEKKISSDQVREKLQAKLDEYHLKFGANMDAKEKSAVKDGIELELLGKAEPKRTYIQVLVDIKNKLVHTDATTDKKEEVFFKVMRELFGSLPITPYFRGAELDVNVREWLLGYQVPPPFEAGYSIELKDTGEPQATAKFNNKIIIDDDILRLLTDMKVSVLQLHYSEWVFKYDSKLSAISALGLSDGKALDLRFEAAGAHDSGSPILSLAASMTVIRDDFKSLVQNLHKVLTAHV